jgi:hypothetical protein
MVKYMEYSFVNLFSDIASIKCYIKIKLVSWALEMCWSIQSWWFHKTETVSYFRNWGSHTIGYEVLYLLTYNAVYSVESQPTFRRNISPPSSGSNKPSKIPAWKQVASRARVKSSIALLATSFYADILSGLFDPEDGGNILLRNFDWLSTEYTLLYPRRSTLRLILLLEIRIYKWRRFSLVTLLYGTVAGTREAAAFICRRTG